MMMAAAVELIYGLIITGRLHLFEQGEGGAGGYWSRGGSLKDLKLEETSGSPGLCVGSRSTHTSVVFFFVFSYERFWLWGLTQVAILENLKIGLPVAGPGCLGIGTSSDLYLYPDAHARTDPFGPFDSPGLYRTFLCFVCICYIRLEGARVWKLAPP